MSEYSATFLDHYRAPRNLGDLEQADVVAIVHEEGCGDLLRLALRVEAAAAPGEGGRIIEARFKAFGCAATIAVASVLTGMVVGKSFAEAAELGEEQIIEALDGLPPARLHAAVLGRRALHDALTRLAEQENAGTA